MLIFICGEPSHMPLKLLTINETDDTAIHHVILVCFICQLKCVILVWVCACGCLWFNESIHSWQPECVCVCVRDERKACRWKDYWRFLSGEKSQCLGKKGTWKVKKMAGVMYFSDGLCVVDGYNEFINMAWKQLCIFSLFSATTQWKKCCLLNRTGTVFVRCALFTDSTKNKQH